MAFEVGLPCGGEIDVFVARAEPALLERAAAELDRGRVVTVRPDGDRLELVSRPAPRLVVVGAVDTAEPLCAGARGLGWRTVVVDPRARYGTPERVPSADELVVRWPEDALPALELDDGSAVVVLAHDDRIDIPALTHALASDAFFVGAIGSRRTQERRRALLREGGVDDEALERIHGPVGLDLGGQAPAEVAVAILAEILAVRNGRGGGALRERSGRIHAGV
jgi:xanthine dehydrogenase accessory factor